MSYDVVIVGGGSAGATLAARLSEEPARSVLLVEAGGGGPLDSEADRLANIDFALTTRDWGLSATVTAGRELVYPQGKFLGGGSSVNGALALRGAPDDYDAWAAAGNPSWSWEQLLPCFRRLEDDRDFATSDLHGRGGPIPIVRYGRDEWLPIQDGFRAACLAVGFPWADDHNDPASTGVGPFPMNRDQGRRMSTALTYLRPALDRPNLTVWSDTTVDRVCLANGRATGVVVRREGRVDEVAAGEVIVSAGAIQSPALLWRSGIGPADRLRALGVTPVVDNPAVGANLMDHPGVFLFFAPGARQAAPPDPQFQLGVRFTSDGGDRNDMLLSMMNYWDLGASPDFQAALGVPAVVVLTCGVHRPRSRGSVSLSSADPDAAPVVDLNLLDDPADVARLVDALRTARRVASAEAMGPFVGDVLLLDDATWDDDAAMAAYVRNLVAPWYHVSGTCRMGPDAADAVVDDGLAVHGLERLRVVDASVMPRIPRAPTNLTVIAIAERAASLIAG
jgi:choline dehydrogenase